MKKKSLVQTKWCCYLLKSKKVKNRTYIGCTNNARRRLRQHNGELKGGARYTRGYRPWKKVLVVKGFKNQTHALQFEWAWKHPRKSRFFKVAREKKTLGTMRNGISGRSDVCKKLLNVSPWNRRDLFIA